jgi:hypothetical protein
MLIEQLLSTFSSPFFGVKLLYMTMGSGCCRAGTDGDGPTQEGYPPPPASPFPSTIKKVFFSLSQKFDAVRTRCNIVLHRRTVDLMPKIFFH